MKDLRTIVWAGDNAQEGRAPEMLIVDADPNGTIEAVEGSIAVNPVTGVLYIKTDTSTTSWSTVSGGGGAVTSVNGDTGAVVVPTAGRLLGHSILTGSGTYTPPAGATSLYVVAIGGGGAGGGLPVDTPSYTFGGLSGGLCYLTINSPAASYAFVCGAGGAPVSGAAGGNGGNTTLAALLLARGGNGGSDANPTPPFASTGGDINMSPSMGSGPILFYVDPDLVPIVGGSGGCTPYGAGGISNATDTGKDATGFGGGGGGTTGGVGFGPFAGGAGAPGGILVWAYS